MADAFNPGEHDLELLYGRPGFLLRRAHQIAVSIFLEGTAAEGVTTASQFGLMLILRARPGLDQISLARLLGLDRSTTGLVISKLESDGMLERTAGVTDRRRKLLTLTPHGLDCLARLEASARQAERRVLSAFDAADAKVFLGLLGRFVAYHNDGVRIPIGAGDRD